MEFKNITIAGGGTLGSQIAWQTAFKGFNVIVFDAFDKGVEASKQFHNQFAEVFKSELNASDAEIKATFDRIQYTTDLAFAVKDCDLISESVPENPEIKIGFYQDLAKVAPAKTIFTTNSSTMLPSQFSDSTGRPEKFLALHFANMIWLRNAAEIMGHPKTNKDVFDKVVEFSKAIGMVPIPIHKEQNGYVMNSLLLPLLISASELLEKEVSDYKSIDKTWMITMQVEMGPFGIMDMIGLETIYNVLHMWGNNMKNDQMLASADLIKREYIEKNKIGMKTKEGFYKYPNPEYSQSGFLK
jgi:3-hydroxyacyl-CoA dehydrogenase